MKVILLEDVYKHGVAGDVVNVAPGFARNYLIPQMMAVKATPGLMRQYENLRQAAQVRRAERYKEYTAVAEQIEGMILYFGVKAGETGKLYGSVTSSDIAERLQEEMGLELDHRRIGDKPLRELGDYDVVVRLDADLHPNVKVVVHPEGEDPLAFLEQLEEEAAAEAALEAELEAAEAVEEVDGTVVMEEAAEAVIEEEAAAFEEEAADDAE